MKKVLIILFIFVLMPLNASAAELFFGVQSQEVGISNKIEVGVFLDTKGEDMNAVSASIDFPEDAFSLDGLYTGSSILNFWLDLPKSDSAGNIVFSGIVPGGFRGSRGYLFSLILNAEKLGKFKISSSEEKVLLNDGQGSEAKITKAPLTLNVVEKSDQTFFPLDDILPPEPFLPEIGKDQNVFDGQYFLVFAAQDKLSGIERYEIMESSQIGSFRNFFEKKEWVLSESPYLLNDQSLRKNIYVKAVDKAGNEIVVKSPAKRFIPLYENYLFWCTILVIAILSRYKLWKKNQPQNILP